MSEKTPLLNEQFPTAVQIQCHRTATSEIKMDIVANLLKGDRISKNQINRMLEAFQIIDIHRL